MQIVTNDLLDLGVGKGEEINDAQLILLGVEESEKLEFRELSLGYSLPAGLLENTFLRSVDISFVGRNLYLWTEYPNFDPETSTTGAVNGQGIEYVAFPQIASFGGRLNITF